MTLLHPRSIRRLGAALLAAVLAAPALRAQQDTALAHPLTLGDAARFAARRSASAEVARYRAAAVAARITQSRAAFLPAVSAYGLESGRSFNTATFGIPLPGYDPNGQVISGINVLDVRGRVSQTLVDLGALGRLRSARLDARAGRANAASVAEQAATLAAAAYLRVQRAEGLVSAREADSVLADSLLQIAHDQVAAGVGVALDVTRAEAQLSSVRAQLIASRNERDQAGLQLRRALGLPLDAPVRLADSLSALPVVDTTPPERTTIDTALRLRPDLRAADQQLLATQQSVRAIRGERLPSLSLFGDEGWIGFNGRSMLNTYTWGVQLSVPIFDGLQRQGRVQEQEALANEIEVQRRDLRQQIAADVRAALLDLASARQQVDAARERLRLSEQELDQARDRFRAGVAGNADVITASLDVNSSRSQVIDALTAYQSARVALARAEGTVTSLP